MYSKGSVREKNLATLFQTSHNHCMKNKARKGMTVQTPDGEYVVRHINRSMTPALVMLTEKYKHKLGRRIYVRENNLQYSIED